MTEGLITQVAGAFAVVALTACIGLFVRVRQLESKRAEANTRLDALEAKAKEAKQKQEAVSGDLQAWKLESERHFVRREDWVPVNSRILGVLERQSEAISRIDENIRVRESRNE